MQLGLIELAAAQADEHVAMAADGEMLAGPTDDDDTQRRVVLNRAHSRGERIPHLPAHGIGPPWIIEGENGDRPLIQFL
jgi:hypothetical protein